MADKYLIILNGQGDTDVILAEAAAQSWITGPAPRFSRGAVKEKIPATVISTHKVGSKTIEITIGSYENDRALQCPGDHFGSVKDALEFVKKNGHNVVDEYHGCIY
jgi:hypothetical protein